jgi:YidC/Oxa1 family membrane protein insertase
LIGLILFSPLTPIENILRDVLDWLHGSAGLPWAWAIVALTIIVRIALVPLTVRQIHSMQSMQAHMPEMKSIQQKYKHDKKRQQEELMKFYRENKINPAASCLPILFQIPIFFALYFVLRKFSKHPPAGSLSWLHIVPNIADHANAHWSGYLLLVIYAASQISSTYFMSATMDKSQRYLMMALPVFFIPFLLRFPMGLVIYWVTTNLWTVGQGLVTRRLAQKPGGAPAGPKRSSRTPPKADGSAAPAPAVVSERDAARTQAQQSQPRRVKRKKRARR